MGLVRVSSSTNPRLLFIYISYKGSDLEREIISNTLAEFCKGCNIGFRFSHHKGKLNFLSSSLYSPQFLYHTTSQCVYNSNHQTHSPHCECQSKLENGSEDRGFTLKKEFCVDPRLDEESIRTDIKQPAFSRLHDGKILDPIYAYNRRMKI